MYMFTELTLLKMPGTKISFKMGIVNRFSCVQLYFKAYWDSCDNKVECDKFKGSVIIRQNMGRHMIGMGNKADFGKT